MSTEESPLLGHNVTAETDEAAYEEDLQDHLYDRFTQKQKRMIVAVVSWTAIIPCMFSVPEPSLGSWCSSMGFSICVRVVHPNSACSCRGIPFDRRGHKVSHAGVPCIQARVDPLSMQPGCYLLYGLSCYIQHDLGHILRILCVLRPTLPLIRIESKDRWSPTNIPRLLTALLHWLSRGRLVQLGVIVNVLACGTGGGDIERYIRRRGCAR